MAGDIEEPFRLSFQVDSIHSGSISFGRFELESLSWERRSSFSHNRYLEEVEKYARPGSVTEKKAYFEAHFRRKALLRQAEKEGSGSENGSYESTTYEENNDRSWCRAEDSQHIHQNSDACHFDESSEGSYCYGDISGIECDVGLTSYAHSETGAETIDVDIVSHFDESSDDSISSGAHKGGEFEEEAEATAHSDLQLESALNSIDLENTVRCCDNKEEFKSESECNGSLTNDVQHEVQADIIPNGQGPELPQEEDISHCTEAMDSASEILENHSPKSRAEEKARKVEPALNRVDLEEVIQCCDNEEKLKSESECKDAITDNVEHDVEAEIISHGQTPKVPKEECTSRCRETRGSPLEILQTHALKSRAEENTRSPGMRSRTQNNASLPHGPKVKKGTAQSSGWRESHTPLRTRTQKPTPQLNGSSLQTSLKISKKENPQSTKAKAPQENKSEKNLKPKREVTLQPSTPERTESRRRPSAAGTKKIASTNKEIKRCAMNTCFRSERGEKVKEVKRSAMNSSLRSGRGSKIREQKKEADAAAQSAKKPNFKAKPLPSFYRQTLPQGSSGNKPQVVSTSSTSSKAPNESSSVGNRIHKGLMPSSKTVSIQPISPSKSEGSHASLGRRNCNVHRNSEAHRSSNTRNHTAKEGKSKVVVQRQ